MIPDEETTLSELLERLRATAAAAIEAKESAERMAIQAFADLRDRNARMLAELDRLKRASAPKRSEAEETMARALVTLGWPRDTGVDPVAWASKIAAAGPGPLAVENAVVAAEKERDAALTETRALKMNLDSADKAARGFLGQIDKARATIVAALKLGPNSATLAELVDALVADRDENVADDSLTVADMRLALDGLHDQMLHMGRWRTEAHAARERECALFCEEAGKVPGFTVRDVGSPIGIFRDVVAHLASAQPKSDLGLRAGVDKLIENARGILGATGDEGLTDAAARVVMERDVLKMRVADLTFKPRVSLEEVQAALAKLAAQYAPGRIHGIASELVAKSITSMQENLAAVGWDDALGQVILSGIRAGVERGLDCMGESYEEQQAKANAEVDKLADKVLVAKLKKLRPWAMVHNLVEYIGERTADEAEDVRAALLKAAGLVKSTRTTLELVAELVEARNKARRDYVERLTTRVERPAPPPSAALTLALRKVGLTGPLEDCALALCRDVEALRAIDREAVAAVNEALLKRHADAVAKAGDDLTTAYQKLNASADALAREQARAARLEARVQRLSNKIADIVLKTTDVVNKPEAPPVSG